jgi:CheY-like chemotaxis protein
MGHDVVKLGGDARALVAHGERRERLALVLQLTRALGELRGDQLALAQRPARAPAGGRDEQERLLGVAAPERAISVVIADDLDLVRTGFRVILESEPDISVVGEAGDGRSAVEVVRNRRPDVVLMDIRMPELDGLKAAERILSDPQLATAVVMLTTFNRDAYIYEALRIGASGFLLTGHGPAQVSSHDTQAGR